MTDNDQYSDKEHLADACTFHDYDEVYCTCCGCTGEPIADCPICDAPVCEDCLEHHHVCDLGDQGRLQQ